MRRNGGVDLLCEELPDLLFGCSRELDLASESKTRARRIRIADDESGRRSRGRQVENRTPRSGSNFDAAFISPTPASWIRSFIGAPERRYLAAIEMARRNQPVIATPKSISYRPSLSVLMATAGIFAPIRFSGQGWKRSQQHE